MRIAIVHDYLNQLGGAEKVVAVLHEMYPEADIHTLFVDHNKLWPSLQNALICPSVLQYFPFIMNRFKLFFWLYPFVIMNKTIRGYDVVISSSSAYAKGIRVGNNGDGLKPIHICYCHTPMRFAWNYKEYIAKETNNKLLSKAARLLVPLMKAWDVHSSRNVDWFIANSSVVQERIRRCYHRESTIIHPPVEVRYLENSQGPTPKGFFLIVSRLVAYKRLDLAIEACNKLDLPLVVVGSGPDRERLLSLAGPTVQFVGFQPEEKLFEYMASCNALIFPGEEDFGITPLEVNSLGRPVVAYHGGGALDTIVEGVNGLFFHQPTVESLSQTLLRVDSIKWNSQEIQGIAKRFERQVFVERMSALVCDAMMQKQRSLTNHFRVTDSGSVS